MIISISDIGGPVERHVQLSSSLVLDHSFALASFPVSYAGGYEKSQLKGIQFVIFTSFLMHEKEIA